MSLLYDYSHGQEWLYRELVAAYYQARRNKRYTANQLKFELNLDRELHELFVDIRDRQYQLGQSIAFVVAKPKLREIFAATFRDRVVHHLVYNWIIDYWERHFIYDSYSCRQDKGTHFGMRRLAHYIRQVTANYTHPAWVMKVDISSYFTSMHHGIMLQLASRILTDPRAGLPDEYLDLLHYLQPIIISARPTRGVSLRGQIELWHHLQAHKSLFNAPEAVGFPIGNLTSQLLSNIYLNELDQFVKNTLRVPAYGRYVDDAYLVSRDREYLDFCRQAINNFLRERLLLHIHPNKTFLHQTYAGVPFIGGIVRPDGIHSGHRLENNYHRFRYTTRHDFHGHDWQIRDIAYRGQLGNFVGWHTLTDAILSSAKG
ncbi:RNA-directed DNA polymerase [bacterium]|nr:RNA-directed DNA polymerase [bacterium]